MLWVNQIGWCVVLNGWNRLNRRVFAGVLAWHSDIGFLERWMRQIPQRRLSAGLFMNRSFWFVCNCMMRAALRNGMKAELLFTGRVICGWSKPISPWLTVQ